MNAQNETVAHLNDAMEINARISSENERLKRQVNGYAQANAALMRTAEACMSVSGQIKKSAFELGYSESMECSELEYLIETARAVTMVNQKNFELVAQANASPAKQLAYVKPGHVRMPDNADDAAMMAIVGMKWLENNAPDKLTKLHRNIKAEAGRFGYLQGHLDALGDPDEIDKEHSSYRADQYAASIAKGE